MSVRQPGLCSRVSDMPYYIRVRIDTVKRVANVSLLVILVVEQ